MMPDRLGKDLDRVLLHTRELWDELRGQRIFITGATGFFGCWLLETFAWANRRLDLNAKATILTRRPDAFSCRAPHLACNPAIHVLTGDVRSFAFPPGEYSHAIQGATESSTVLNAQQPQLMFDTIVEGTRRCLEFAAEARTRRFLLISSGAVYGSLLPEMTHVPEYYAGGPDPLNPRSAYAEGKRAAELLCALAAGGTALEPAIARCFAFVGPYMKLDAHFAIGNFIRDHLNGGPIRVQGDGTPLRSYMYAGDLMIWLWTILLRGTPGRAYNVGSEQAVSVAELAREVEQTLSPPVEVEIMSSSTPGLPRQTYVPSTVRAREELGLECRVSLRDAIRRTRDWFASRKGGLI